MPAVKKTLPILQQDLQESGIRCELAEPDSVWRAGVVYLRTGSLSGGFAYPGNQNGSHHTGQSTPRRHTAAETAPPR